MKPPMLKNMNDLRWCVSTILERPFYHNRWIGDNTILSILHSKFHLYHIDKTYLNKHLSNISFNLLKSYRHTEEKLFYGSKSVRRAYFYYFSSKDTTPIIFTKQFYSDIYFNDQVMMDNFNSNSNSEIRNEKRCVLGEITMVKMNNHNIVSPPVINANNKRRLEESLHEFVGSSVYSDDENEQKMSIVIPNFRKRASITRQV